MAGDLDQIVREYFLSRFWRVGRGNNSIFQRKAYHLSFSMASVREPTLRSVISLQSIFLL